MSSARKKNLAINISLYGATCSEETKKIHSNNSKNRVWITNTRSNLCKMVKSNKVTNLSNNMPTPRPRPKQISITIIDS